MICVITISKGSWPQLIWTQGLVWFPISEYKILTVFVNPIKWSINHWINPNFGEVPRVYYIIFHLGSI